MNKQELIASIASKTNLSKKDSAAALEGVCSSVIQALQSGESVQITGFGSFQVANRAERQGRNPRTGESITIPAKKTAKFKPSKDFKLS